MKTLLLLYNLALHLYPGAFRSQFADEMQAVFQHRLARQPGLVSRLRLAVREAWALPGGLAWAYLWAMRSGVEPSPVLSTGPGSSLPHTDPPPARSDQILAGLPHLLLGLLGGLPSLAAAAGIRFLPEGLSTSSIMPFIMVIPGLLFVLVYGLLRGWGRWSASWAVYLLMTPLIFLLLLMQTMLANFDAISGVAAMVQQFVMVILLAFLLYQMAVDNRQGALLAAILPMTVLWVVFHEFVPDLWRGLIYLWMFGVAGAAAVLVLRTRQYNRALLLALSAPVLGGFANAALGVYVGGTLPFSASGPNLGIVVSQYLPYLALSSTLALGPMLAIEIRRLGTASKDWHGRVWHRLALGALLFAAILIALRFAMDYSDSSSIKFSAFLHSQFMAYNGVGLLAAIGLFLAAYLMLIGAILRSGQLWEERMGWLKLSLLPVTLATLPLLIYSGIPQIYYLPFNLDEIFRQPIVAVIWLAAAVAAAWDY